ncbi:P-loop containing nucleoside triphosphate hydrolase protein [Massarina eburnea CBS 473.64]|uniref:ATP-dependent DNA helicase n=1 Tax=Massarina eburnea CBS 473.64 TaxID=1395130 RepID=A0A6A6RIA1_9PLEO|nr:P-loop containing nucleoside triphosphate hydrolase protein [Massarina eburnea CBS 473.64]
MDSDDYGDDLDDTAFLDAATQAEKENSPPFQPSPRPLKRRKLDLPNEGPTTIPPRLKQQQRRRQRPFVSSGDDSDSDAAISVVPAAQKGKRRSLQDDEAGEGEIAEEESPRKETLAEKRKNRIHVPTANLNLIDAFCTQPPQEPSPPWKPRGAIWQKPTATVGVYRTATTDSTRTISLSGRQSTAPRSISRVIKPPKKSAPVIDLEQSPKLPVFPIRNMTVPDYDPTEELADLPSDAFASSSSSPQKQDATFATSQRQTRVIAPTTGLRQTTLFGREGTGSEAPRSQVNKRYSFIVDRKEEPPTHHKLDPEAIKTWVYPTNLGTIRDYQFNIVHAGLFHNLLVALPTGLGKTFIAATIMLNFFRWSTESQIVFVAPTKPLVAQQVDACFHTVGMPRSQTTMLTGGVSKGLRAQEWANKRVFFMTPQTLLNDLKSGYADPKKIVLLVVDEAHRATGAYAYVEVVSFLRRFNSSFRVLALTATPGADVEAVQKVIDGLDISKVEIRTENSMDIRRFVHDRKVEKHVFTNNDELEMCLELFEKAIQPVFNKVAGLGVLYSSNPRDITPYGCMQARAKWLKDAGQHANQGFKSMINAVFTVLGSVSQGLELLKFHGIGPFYMKIKEFRDDNAKSKSKYKKEICDSEAFKKLMARLQTGTSNENFIGHPKLEFLQQVVIEHFVNAAEGVDTDSAATRQTRIMVFAHFRDSAEEIVRVLKKHEPMIKPHVFVGQQNSKNSDGMDQKSQLAVIEKFKAGTYNTLVATSIGEEGLDIGEVDLIICYDSKASPIRMLQRMGRTGRKREGKIIMLQMEGKEENDSAKAKDSYERMQELIANGDKFIFHDEISRRILPRAVIPAVEKRAVEIPIENSQQDWLPEPTKKRGKAPKQPAKKFNMPDGVITGFVTAGRMDEELAPKNRMVKAVKVYPSDAIFQLPPLESVLLDDAATKDLEQRYQTVFDDNDAPIVGALDLSAHPKDQRFLSRTHEFRRHGIATQRFVGMLQRIHAMNDDRIDEWGQKLRYSDREVMPDSVVLLDGGEHAPVVQNDGEDTLWAEDDPASQPLSKPKAKPGPKHTAKATPRSRGRPRKDALTTTPIRKSKDTSQTPRTKTPNWRVSDLAGEGGSSSPPPTDPRMRIASQAETIGSDDTLGSDDPQDTQAYRLDSDLVGFIAEDDEDVEMQMSDSSLPGMSFSGVGNGTQAVVKAGKPKRAKKAEKIFTSDPTDDDAVVSSDSDDDVPLGRKGVKGSKTTAVTVDSASESEYDAPVVRKKRPRRVIDDDDDDE